MQKIITVTLNTAIDHIIEVPSFRLGKTHRSKNAKAFPSGKGINVTRTLNVLGKKAVAMGFVGRSSLNFYKTLDSDLCSMQLIVVDGKTRRNISIIDPEQNTLTHIINPGYEVSNSDLRKFKVSFQDNVNNGDVVVLSGSLPVGTPTSFYKELLQVCHDKNALTILDSSGEPLREGLKGKPFMVKPNLDELEYLAGKELRRTENKIIEAAREILKLGIQLVVVSRGAKGILAVKNGVDTTWKAFIDKDKINLPAICKGSGDALVAGFTAGYLENREFPDILRLGVACGAANLLTPCPGTCNIKDIEQFVLMVKVETIDY